MDGLKAVDARDMKIFVFSGDKLLLKGDGSVPSVDEIPECLAGGRKDEISSLTMGDGAKVATLQLGDVSELPEGWELVPLRSSWSVLSDEDYRHAGKCRQILYWDNRSHFCGVCGTKLERTGEISKRCPVCGEEWFAPVSTAIIVLVTRGEEALLVHARNFRGTHYGLVAGFLETGETLEECVAREVMEETGLSVRDIRYVGSQTWPYPNQLMAAFRAEYDGGEIRLQDDELSAGAFYRRDALPELPGKPSIARAMIEDWKIEI